MIFDLQRYSTHDGPGIRTLVFLKGCSLACRWCQNPESRSPKPDILLDRRQCIEGCQLCSQACPAILRDSEGIQLSRSALKADDMERLRGLCPSEALQVCGVPAVEVMLADPSGKEPFRSVDVVSFGCQGRFAGEGVSGYLHACAYLVQLLRLDGGAQTLMVPMVEQVMARCGQAPEAWLVDGGFVGHEQIEQASQHTVVYGPVPEPKDKTVDPHQAKATDSPAVGAWRERMGTDEAKEIYKKRAATAECVNAQSRNRGLQQFPVRGLAKVTCVVLLFALAHNLMRMADLAPQLLGIGAGTSSVPGIGL